MTESRSQTFLAVRVVFGMQGLVPYVEPELVLRACEVDGSVFRCGYPIYVLLRRGLLATPTTVQPALPQRSRELASLNSGRCYVKRSRWPAILPLGAAVKRALWTRLLALLVIISLVADDGDGPSSCLAI